MTATAIPVASESATLRHRLAALDGIRGLAAMAVLLSHTSYVVLPGGFVGVDVFFVLSGFIITGLIVDEARATGRVRLARFWSRRATRLLPPALGVVLVTLGLSMWLDPWSTRQATVDDSVFAALYVENWHLIARGDDYFGESLAPSRLQHYWSLAVEEQFYLVWPVVMVGLLGVYRLGRHRTLPSRTVHVLVVVAALAAASFLIAVRSDDGAGLSSYMGTTSRVWQLLLGAGLAMVWRAAPRWLDARQSDLALVVGTGLVVGTAAVVTSHSYLPVGAVAAAGGALAMIAALVSPGPLGRRIFESRPMQHLGRTSYSIYLWHWPVVLFGTELADGRFSDLTLTVLQITGTLVLATLSLHLLENPLRHVRIRDTRPMAVIAVAVAASVLVAGFATAVGRYDASSLPSLEGVDLARAADDPSVTACPDEPEPCVRHAGSSDFVLATVGDSTMQHFDPALMQLARRHDFTYVQAAIGGCPLGHRLLATGTDSLHKPSNLNCYEWFPGGYERLLDEFEPDIVLATSSNERSRHVDADGTLVEAGTDAHLDQTRDALVDTLELLAERAEVVTVDQLSGGTTVDCLAEADRAEDCQTFDDNPRVAKYNELVRDAASGVDGVSSIGLNPVVCPDGRCPPILKHHVVRYDGGHFTGGFARTLADDLAEGLAEVGVRLPSEPRDGARRT